MNQILRNKTKSFVFFSSFIAFRSSLDVLSCFGGFHLLMNFDVCDTAACLIISGAFFNEYSVLVMLFVMSIDFVVGIKDGGRFVHKMALSKNHFKTRSKIGFHIALCKNEGF